MYRKIHPPLGSVRIQYALDGIQVNFELGDTLHQLLAGIGQYCLSIWYRDTILFCQGQQVKEYGKYLHHRDHFAVSLITLLIGGGFRIYEEQMLKFFSFQTLPKQNLSKLNFSTSNISQFHPCY